MPNDVDPLDVDADQWSMGDLPRLTEAAKMLKGSLAQVSTSAAEQEKSTKELESSLLKSEW